MFILLITAIDVIGWYCIKKYHLTGNYYFFLTTLTAYILMPILILKVLPYEGIGNTNMIWNVMSTILVLLVGCVIYKESINHGQFIGILFGILSIVLICVNEKSIKS